MARAKDIALPLGMEFGEPPAPAQERRNDVFWQTVADTLRQHPGRWAKVKTYPSKGGAVGRANSINAGKAKVFPQGEFTARYSVVESSAEGNGSSELWMIYTPPTDGQ